VLDDLPCDPNEEWIVNVKALFKNGNSAATVKASTRNWVLRKFCIEIQILRVNNSLS